VHPLAWFAWLGTASLVTLLTRNPLYLVVLFVIFILVMDVERASQRAAADSSGYDGAPSDRGLPLSPLRFALFAVPAGAVFNLLTSHVGETVFFRLPAAIPLIGGALTAEALLYGAISGLVLVTLFTAFAVLNLALPVRDLIAYIPRAFYPVAIVSAIAVTFVPNTLRQFRQVREAQAIRGYKMHGWRDWLPLFLPVLVGGLERALQGRPDASGAGRTDLVGRRPGGCVGGGRGPVDAYLGFGSAGVPYCRRAVDGRRYLARWAWRAAHALPPPGMASDGFRCGGGLWHCCGPFPDLGGVAGLFSLSGSSLASV